MASRAQVIHDYSFGGARSLRRRQAWYHSEDPITLPKSSVWVAGLGALVTALATGAIVAAGAYAAFHVAPARLSDTPELAPAREWQPDLASVNAAGLVRLMQGPALAVPDKALAPLENVEESAAAAAAATTPSESREVIIDDSKLYPLDESKRYPRTAPPEQPPVPYPDPVTTPPDAIAPPATNPAKPTPILDPENPYRDGV
jgi:hypothetical protein